MSYRAYQTKTSKLSGTNFSEVYHKAFSLYRQIKKRTKRRPYIRSKYFKKDKIFLTLYWHHLHEKFNHRDKIRRVKYFPCALELIQNTMFEPDTKENVDEKGVLLHRFTGISPEKEIFFVQIKQDKRTAQKYFMSVFPLG